MTFFCYMLYKVLQFHDINVREINIDCNTQSFEIKTDTGLAVLDNVNKKFVFKDIVAKKKGRTFLELSNLTGFDIEITGNSFI